MLPPICHFSPFVFANTTMVLAAICQVSPSPSPLTVGDLRVMTLFEKDPTLHCE